MSPRESLGCRTRVGAAGGGWEGDNWIDGIGTGTVRVVCDDDAEREREREIFPHLPVCLLSFFPSFLLSFFPPSFSPSPPISPPLLSITDGPTVHLHSLDIHIYPPICPSIYLALSLSLLPILPRSSFVLPPPPIHPTRFHPLTRIHPPSHLRVR